ncbi:hypothetical protein [Crocosphaera chwakensis]|uniref:Uncharacterized protein n=1 Tax=Crocosphaera chwakensis CCY0110 TaxID=391612 RepID=A3IPU6_9CHRO|nr:hypothetical protein [Crocosphaera chwakensis]EAZ91586.1 hypothetical protein CY0110_13736 [Crocosphaera chwakensis CCY0110]
MENTLFDKIFRDDQGNIVIAQPPNLPLIVAVTAFLLKQFISNDNLYMIINIIAFGSFFTWGWMELFKGVNYLRRTFGLVALLGIIYAKFYNYF